MNLNMAQGQMSGNMIGHAAVPPKQSMMAEHAQRLHDMAGQLNELNARLANALDRMSGPTPETANGPAGATPAPSGVLYVAQFGAERIGIEIDKARGLIGRLEAFA